MLRAWRTVPVEHRVGLGFVLFLFLLLAVSVVAAVRMARMHEVTTQIASRTLPAIEDLGRFETDARAFRTTDYRYLLEFDAAGKAQAMHRFNQTAADAEIALLAYRRTIAYHEDRAHFDDLDREWHRYLGLHAAVMSRSSVNDIRGVSGDLNGPMRLSFYHIEGLTSSMAAWNWRTSERLAEDEDTAYRFSRLLVFGLFLAAVLMGGGASWFITDSVRNLMLHIKERQLAQEALRAKEQLYKAIVANASDVILILLRDGTVGYASPSVSELWGYAPSELKGTVALDLIHPEDQHRAQTFFGLAADAPATNFSGELRIRCTNDIWLTSEVVANDQFAEPAVNGIVLTCRDITERKLFEEQLSHQAFHDPLSGLPNRALFLDRLDRALLRAGAMGRSVAVMFLDLDNFKVVNDSLGHDAGDEMLIEVAKRLSTCVRPQDTVARLGGDEFTILLEDIDGPDVADEMASRVARVLNRAVQLKGHDVFTSASIGVSVSAGRHELPGEMLRDADTAMYQAKAAGKAHHIVFDPTMNERANERLEMESELRRAIDNGELRLHYQPIIDLESGDVTEVEALVRWNHPVRGVLPPLRFIPVAEETGLILPLGQWVLEEACRQARQWQKEFPTEIPLTVGVNLSTRQFAQADLVEVVARTLRETGLPASSLKLEITESLMMINPEATRAKLVALRNLGCRLAVDDFGTGYSSMAYLSRFPLDTIKIDKSFVGGLGEQTEADAIVRAIITLAKTLNLHVTSEGIETADQLVRLNDLGSDLGQGFFFSRPLTSHALQELLANPDRVPRLEMRKAA